MLFVLSACDGTRPLSDIEAALRKNGAGRSQAQIELRRFGEQGLKVWLAVLAERKDFTLFTSGLAELKEYGDAAQVAIPLLIEHLRDGFPGMQAPETQSVIERFEHPDEVRKHAGQALAQFGAAAVGELSKLLSHTNVRVRQEVVLTLGRIGKPAATVINEIVKRLADEDAAVAASAAWALGRIEQVNDLVLAAAKNALTHSHYLVRFETLKALRAFGGRALSLRTDIEKCLKEDENANVRAEASQVLSGLPAPEKSKKTDPAKKDPEKKDPAKSESGKSAGK